MAIRGTAMRLQKAGSIAIVAVLAGTCLALQPSPKAEDVARLAEGNGGFAADLYGRLQVGLGNLFYSPYSISTALGMTYLGARGETERQMAQTLHFELGQERLHPAMAELQAMWRASAGNTKRAYKLSTANAVWVQEGEKLLDDYVKAMETYYRGGLDTIDFGKAEAAAATINKWVEGRTNEKIKDLLQPPVVAGASVVLVNAIYFRGLWEKPFDKKLTTDGDFHVSGEKTVKAKMMHMTGQAVIGEDDEKQVLVLPYLGRSLHGEAASQAAAEPHPGSDLSMVIILPKKQDGIADAAKWLKPGELDRLLAGAHGVEAEITMPKFRMTQGFKLASTLKDMGMAAAFGPGADFSGMSSRGLFISEVVHKAFVEVDEEGTEAAAATAVIMKRAAAAVNGEVVKFTADHPFVFVIRDNEVGSMLFIGRVVNPTEGGDVKE
jgi:serpin B